MKSELIVDVRPSEVSFALLEDSRLVSLQKEARNISYAVGDIYLAKVKKLMPGLNAAFVNVGYEKDAFLHYLDLGSHFASYAAFVKQLLSDKQRVPSISKQKPLPDIDKHGSIADQLQSGQELLVQIVKEPISSKGPRLTTEITFTGRYLVLIPFSDKISISQKIKSTEEKLRLRQLIESIKPKNFGVIVRTSAEGTRVADLNHELKTLIKCWEDAIAKAQRSEAPALIFEEESRIVGMLRDIFSPTFENITVNDPDIYSQISKYVALIAPERKDSVKLYDRDEPIFDHFAITRQIKSSFGKTVSFKSGAYLIIEHTEALHVIDVNSGNRAKATNDQETNALEVNLRAADEIARQLRLRDMGGIIVIDFIDMNKSEHRQQLYDHMREIMANDRARHNILPLSKFGLMQITRQRVRPALDITTTERCPSCFGKGEVQPSLLFTDTLHEKIDYIVSVLGLRNFIMYVHPFVDAYIKKGLFTSLYGKWRRQFGRCFKILPDQSLAYLEYKVFDDKRNELCLHEDKDRGSSSSDKKKNKVQTRGSEGKQEEVAPTAEDESSSAKTEAPKSRRKKKKSAATEKPAPTDAIETALPAQPEADTAETTDKPEAPKEDAPAASVEKPVKKKKSTKPNRTDKAEISEATDQTAQETDDKQSSPKQDIVRQPKTRKQRKPAQKAENEPDVESPEAEKIKIELFDMPPALPPATSPSPTVENSGQNTEE